MLDRATAGLLSSIFFWAGGWNLIDAYFYHDQVIFVNKNLSALSKHHYESQYFLAQPFVSKMLSAVIGVVGMMVMGVSRSLHGGLSKDGHKGEAYPLQVDWRMSNTIVRTKSAIQIFVKIHQTRNAMIDNLPPGESKLTLHVTTYSNICCWLFIFKNK